jgi:elongation factor P--beta-lysine ligase
MPQKFLKALARLPECGGIALGMDGWSCSSLTPL